MVTRIGDSCQLDVSASNFEALPGRGAKALLKGKSIEIGGPRLLTEAKVTVPPEVEKLTTPWASDGKTVLYAVAQGRLHPFSETVFDGHTCSFDRPRFLRQPTL
jgi:cation transport ATPase